MALLFFPQWIPLPILARDRNSVATLSESGYGEEARFIIPIDKDKLPYGDRYAAFALGLWDWSGHGASRDLSPRRDLCHGETCE